MDNGQLTMAVPFGRIEIANSKAESSCLQSILIIIGINYGVY